jgi:hypothetical protein
MALLTRTIIGLVPADVRSIERRQRIGALCHVAISMSKALALYVRRVDILSD